MFKINWPWIKLMREIDSLKFELNHLKTTLNDANLINHIDAVDYAKGMEPKYQTLTPAISIKLLQDRVAKLESPNRGGQ